MSYEVIQKSAGTSTYTLQKATVTKTGSHARNAGPLER